MWYKDDGKIIRIVETRGIQVKNVYSLNDGLVELTRSQTLKGCITTLRDWLFQKNGAIQHVNGFPKWFLVIVQKKSK